jgi:hypothetical protein
LLAIGPLGLMAGGAEDHFTDSRELYVLVEGDEWAHVEALDSDAGYCGLCASYRGAGATGRRRHHPVLVVICGLVCCCCDPATGAEA